MRYYCTKCHQDLDPIADKKAIGVLKDWRTPERVRDSIRCYRCWRKDLENAKKRAELLKIKQ